MIPKNININGYILLTVFLLLVPVYAESDYNYRLGDVNKDGSIDIADMVYLFKHLHTPDVNVEDDDDLNADNNIDIADVVYLFVNYQKMREPIHYAQNVKITYYDEYGNEVNPYNGESYAYKIVEDATGQRFLLKNKSQPISSWAEENMTK